MQRSEFRAMGSNIVAVLDVDGASPVLRQVPQWFEAWEQVLSRFRVDSELSQLNARVGIPTRMSDVLAAVYAAALEAHDETAGLVDPLILDALVQAGYDRTFDQLPDAALAYTADAPARTTLDCAPRGIYPQLKDVVFDPSKQAIVLPEGASLDFGGVAKGWAAHQAAERLQATAPALVSAGGDVAVSGPRADGQAWPIGVNDPFGGPEYLEIIYLAHGGVATSGRDRRRWIHAGIPQHHVIDPRTHMPAQTDVLTATVIGPSVMKAEAIAKAVLISGSETGLEWLNADASLAGMLVLDDGRRLWSRRFEDYL